MVEVVSRAPFLPHLDTACVAAHLCEDTLCGGEGDMEQGEGSTKRRDSSCSSLNDLLNDLDVEHLDVILRELSQTPSEHHNGKQG